MQTFMAPSQRGAKGHPLGRFSKSIGVPVKPMNVAFGSESWMIRAVGTTRRVSIVPSSLRTTFSDSANP
jgi:hypothetical protein